MSALKQNVSRHSIHTQAQNYSSKDSFRWRLVAGYLWLQEATAKLVKDAVSSLTQLICLYQPMQLANHHHLDLFLEDLDRGTVQEHNASPPLPALPAPVSLQQGQSPELVRSL